MMTIMEKEKFAPDVSNSNIWELLEPKIQEIIK